MSQLHKTRPGETYFITFSVTDWVDLFTRHEYAAVVEDALVYGQQHKGLQLYAWCLMTNHLHLVASRADGLMADWIRDAKAHTARTLLDMIAANPQESRREWMLERFARAGRYSSNNTQYQLWQDGYHALALSSRPVTEEKIHYIYQNPVRAGWVTAGEHYRWCSWHPECRAKCLDW